MQRRRLVLALVLLALPATGLRLAGPAPVAAVTSQTFTHIVAAEVGAGRDLPNGTWGYNDVCTVGYDSGTHESRCSVEFNVSGILSSATILSAKLSFDKTGGCGTQDCPVDVYLFTGNGSADLTDVVGGSFNRTVTPGFSQPNFDIPNELQARISNGDDYLGVRLSRAATSTHSVPDVQAFGYSSFKLAVTFIQRPVDITIQLGGPGTGNVGSSPEGIDCGQACTGTFEWLEPLTLTATPQNGGSFNHWEGGACDGSTNPVCSFDTPATDPKITAFFDPIGPPISQPPGATPTPVPTQLTPPPLPTTRPSSGPLPTGGPAPTAAPAPTDVIASDGAVITPPPPTLAPGATTAPTIVGLGDPGEAAASAGVPLPLLIVLILILGGVVGGGVYWFTKRQQAGAP